MPLNIPKILFPKATMEQFATCKDKRVILHTYSNTSKTQLGVCSIAVKHKNKNKLDRFFVVPKGRYGIVRDARQ